MKAKQKTCVQGQMRKLANYLIIENITNEDRFIFLYLFIFIFIIYIKLKKLTNDLKKKDGHIAKVKFLYFIVILRLHVIGKKASFPDFVDC